MNDGANMGTILIDNFLKYFLKSWRGERRYVAGGEEDAASEEKVKVIIITMSGPESRQFISRIRLVKIKIYKTVSFVSICDYDLCLMRQI